MPTCCHLNSRT